MLNRQLGIKIAKFVGLAAYEFLVPDAISKPIAILKNFYSIFLHTTLQDRLTLYAEATSATGETRRLVVRALVNELCSHLPAGQQSAAHLEPFCGNLVDGLRAANEAEKRGEDAGEALRIALNRQFFGGEEKIVTLKLAPAEQQIGRLRVTASLQLQADTRTPPPLNIKLLPTLPDYEFLQTIGQGGFATVYKALHRPSGELRAIKIADLTEPDRLQRELRSVEQLNSPHLLKYHEHGTFTEGGREQYWIGMEYLGEQTLADVLRTPEVRNQPEVLLLIGEQILTGLRDLHAAGFLHRDIKPANIMFDTHNRVKLIDYGLVKPLAKFDAHSTSTLSAMGTPLYMSPEQLRGSKELTPAADLYCYGLVVYELFTSTNPNAATSLAEVILNACTKTPDVAVDGIPLELQPVLGQCLRMVAKERVQSADALLADYGRAAKEATTRITFERDRQSWLTILDKNLLPQYLQRCADQSHSATPQGFNDYLRSQQVAAVSETRLAEVLPELMAVQEQIEAAKAAVAHTRQAFAKEAGQLSTEQINQRVQQLNETEYKLKDIREFMLQIVRQMIKVMDNKSSKYTITTITTAAVDGRHNTPNTKSINRPTILSIVRLAVHFIINLYAVVVGFFAGLIILSWPVVICGIIFLDNFSYTKHPFMAWILIFLSIACGIFGYCLAVVSSWDKAKGGVVFLRMTADPYQRKACH